MLATGSLDARQRALGHHRVDILSAFLANGRRRMLKEFAMQWLAGGTAVAASLLLAFELVIRRWPTDPAWPYVWACIGIGAAFAAGGWLSSWPSLAIVAHAADQRLSTHDRLVTALEFANQSGYLIRLQRSDAEDFLSSADVARFTIRMSFAQPLIVATAATSLALILALLPNPSIDVLRQKQEARLTQIQAAQRISAIAQAEQSKQLQFVQDPTTHSALINTLRSTANAVRNAADPASAVAALNQAQSAINSLMDPTLSTRQQAATAAGQALSANRDSGSAGQALANGDDRAAAADLRQLSAALEAMSPGQRTNLANSLFAAAAASNDNQSLSNALQAAANALQSNDLSKAQDALTQAANAADQLGSDSATAADLDQTVKELQQVESSLVTRGTQSGQQGNNGSNQNSSSGQDFKSQIASSNQDASSSQILDSQNSALPTDFVYVPGQTPVSGQGQPQGSGQGINSQLLPYQAVLAEYESAALAEVDREIISDSDRQLVEAYFTALSK